MKMRSVMQHSFSQIPKAEIPRSSFDRSHGYKTTFDAGLLIPFFLDEALPGDTFNVSMTGFARMATPIFPVMDNLFMETHYFAIPLRLIWDNFQKFCGEQENPGDSTDYTIPIQFLAASSVALGAGSMADYFGLPLGITGLEYSSLPFRAYALMYNQWFRDENLQNSVFLTKGDGPDSTAPGFDGYPIRRRGKRHDYFTSCLPWPQKGDAVSLPLGDFANIIPVGDLFPRFQLPDVGDATSRTLVVDPTSPGGGLAGFNETDLSGAVPAGTGSRLAWLDPQLVVDMTTATAATVNQLRQAFAVQKLYERDARGGTRYTEVVKAHFGVTSPDQRLQRVEYLGGGSSMVNISPVVQTSETAETPQGNLSAIGTAALRGHGFQKSFTEHCIVIGVVSVRADLTYQQGMDRMWSRRTRPDFYWPALSHIGEQAVLNKEIYAQGTADDELVFGYQARYDEYRYKPSRITGLFRSSAAGSLDAWHLSQDFAVLPTLGATFISDNPPIDRVIAVPTEPHFLFDSYISFRCARPMPMFGVPGQMDRF